MTTKDDYIIRVRHKNGMRWAVKSVKLGHFKNINGTQGAPSYILTSFDGSVRYYPRTDITDIIQTKKGEN